MLKIFIFEFKKKQEKIEIIFINMIKYVKVRFSWLIILFFLTSLLEYNCFTLLCQLLLYNNVNQLYMYIYPHIPSLLRLPPTLPIPPLQVVTKHELISLCYAGASHQLSILHLVVYICPCHSLTSFQLTLTPPHVKSILYVCIFIPVLPLGSSEPLFFFQIPYICVSLQYLFFSF